MQSIPHHSSKTFSVESNSIMQRNSIIITFKTCNNFFSHECDTSRALLQWKWLILRDKYSIGRKMSIISDNGYNIDMYTKWRNNLRMCYWLNSVTLHCRTYRNVYTLIILYIALILLFSNLKTLYRIITILTVESVRVRYAVLIHDKNA